MAKGTSSPAAIRAGHRLGGQVQVLDGLKAGEQVAVERHVLHRLREPAARGARRLHSAGGGSGSGSGGAAAGVAIALTSDPNPPRAGMTRFQATVTTRAGQPIADATVTLVLYMPPMPSMNMPAMRSEAALGHAGAACTAAAST